MRGDAGGWRRTWRRASPSLADARLGGAADGGDLRRAQLAVSASRDGAIVLSSVDSLLVERNDDLYEAKRLLQQREMELETLKGRPQNTPALPLPQCMCPQSRQPAHSVECSCLLKYSGSLCSPGHVALPGGPGRGEQHSGGPEGGTLVAVKGTAGGAGGGGGGGAGAAAGEEGKVGGAGEGVGGGEEELRRMRGGGGACSGGAALEAPHDGAGGRRVRRRAVRGPGRGGRAPPQPGGSQAESSGKAQSHGSAPFGSLPVCGWACGRTWPCGRLTVATNSSGDSLRPLTLISCCTCLRSMLFRLSARRVSAALSALGGLPP